MDSPSTTQGPAMRKKGVFMGFRFQVSSFKFQDSRVQGSKFEVQGSRFKVQGSKELTLTSRLRLTLTLASGEFGGEVEEDTDEGVEDVYQEDMGDDVFFFQFGGREAENKVLAQGLECKDRHSGDEEGQHIHGIGDAESQ